MRIFNFFHLGGPTVQLVLATLCHSLTKHSKLYTLTPLLKDLAIPLKKKRKKAAKYAKQKFSSQSFFKFNTCR